MPYKQSKRIYINPKDDKRIKDLQLDLSKVKKEIYSKMRIISELLDKADEIFFSVVITEPKIINTENIRNERDGK